MASEVWRVYVHNRFNYAYTYSPDFSYEGACHTWISEHFFDSGVDVEIQRVVRVDVPYTDLSRLPEEITGINSKISFTDKDYINDTFWHNGCVRKETVYKMIPKEEGITDEQ